jgi:hypothetical protein
METLLFLIMLVVVLVIASLRWGYDSTRAVARSGIKETNHELNG